MTFRKSVFWVHLAAGIAAALFIAIMCVTGAVLAFEKQLVMWAERDVRRVEPPADPSQRITLEDMSRRVREAHPEARPSSVMVSSDPGAAVAFVLGREQTAYVDPYTGALRSPATTHLHDFMHVMEDWHRWLAVSGDHRPVGKVINGVANIVFFVLAVTGLYIWMPKRWSWSAVRSVALFNWQLTGKKRDFNWHNVIGFWTSPVLIVLTLTAVPISFRWGNALVYRLVGEEPPAQAGPPGAMAPVSVTPPSGNAGPLDRDAQFSIIQREFPGWEQITWRSSAPGARPGSGSPAPAAPASGEPSSAAPTSRGTTETRRSGAPQASTFIVKLPNAWPRTATTTVVLHPYTGEVLQRQEFADQTAGRQLRIWTRFLHTGEALGWVGQLVAGLACLGGCFLVYTGVALSWRRFFRKKEPRRTMANRSAADPVLPKTQ